MTSVLTTGSTTLDLIFYVEAFPATAEKHRAKKTDIAVGGCAANAAVAIASLGGAPLLAAEIGDDHLADIILGELRQAGLDTRLVRRIKGARSSFSSVFVDAKGERMIVNYRGQGLHMGTGLPGHASKVDAVLVDSRWPEGAATALDLARERGTPGIMDVEAGVDPALLGRATHLAFSAQGLRSLHPGLSLEDALAKAASEHETWACVTDGDRGVKFTDAGRISHSPAFAVTAVDTLGAGDVWHGAFALILAEGAGEQAAIEFASAAAALKCASIGGLASIPDRGSVIEFLKECEHAVDAG